MGSDVRVEGTTDQPFHNCATLRGNIATIHPLRVAGCCYC